VLFVHAFGDKVQALDASTGDLLWQYSPQLPPGSAPSVKRAIAIYGDRLYVPASDVHIVALDARTGHVVWDQAIGSRKEGFGVTGGPLVARGKVMLGTIGRAAGCSRRSKVGAMSRSRSAALRSIMHMPSKSSVISTSGTSKKLSWCGTI
jgi:glucose dehydrogenase